METEVKTPLQEIIHWLEVRMYLYPDTLDMAERNAYDSYKTILNMAKSKISYEKKTMDKNVEYKQWLEVQIEKSLSADLQREHWAFCKAYEKLMEEKKYL